MHAIEHVMLYVRRRTDERYRSMLECTCGREREPCVESFIFEQGTDMKSIVVLSMLAVMLGGCVLVPAEYGDERGYYRGDGNHRDRDYNRGDGRYPEYGYYRNQGNPYHDHGG
jgi:hypothetical protein